jgi:predicted O-linked N-acetylglucosamine transferase (SPINDLY family)
MVWLGREMSSGSGFIDVMVTDKILSPPDSADFYTEHLIYLPVSGLTAGPDGTSMPLASDNLHHSTPDSVTARRKAWGLRPESLTLGVLGPASFIDPDLWAVWMEVLRYTPQSQLWLTRGGSQHVRQNLQYQAEQSGILPSRIVVSDTDVPSAEAAVLADLILDSRALNADAADMLAAVLSGVPVLSLPGDCPCRRSSASLLVAHGLAGLFTTRDLADYEETATRLGKSLLQVAKCGSNLRYGAAALSKRHSATALKTDSSSTKRQWDGIMGALDRAWALAWEVTVMQENVQHRDKQKFHIIVAESILSPSR